MIDSQEDFSIVWEIEIVDGRYQGSPRAARSNTKVDMVDANDITRVIRLHDRGLILSILAQTQ